MVHEIDSATYEINLGLFEPKSYSTRMIPTQTDELIVLVATLLWMH